MTASSSSSSLGLRRLLLYPNLHELRREMITVVLPRYNQAFSTQSHDIGLVRQLHFSEPGLTTWTTSDLWKYYAKTQPMHLHACWMWLLLGLAQYDLEYRSMLFAAEADASARQTRFMEELLRIAQSFLNGTDEIALLFDELEINKRSKSKEITMTRLIDHLSFFFNTL